MVASQYQPMCVGSNGYVLWNWWSDIHSGLSRASPAGVKFAGTYFDQCLAHEK